MKRIMVTVLSLLLCAVSLKAEAPKTLADYKAIYERELKNLNAAKEEGEIEQNYLKALASLEIDYKKAGDFPGTKAVLEERKRFEACRMLPDTTPDGAVQGIADAQKAYRNAYAEADGIRKAKLEKLTTQYINALKGYTRKLLESDKMSEAEEVNGEIVKAETYLKTITPVTAPAPNVEAPEPNAEAPVAKKLDRTIKIPRIRGLVAYYPFNGNADNAVMNKDHGVVQGALLTTDRFGKKDSAYYFNGTDAYISLGNASPITNNKGTLSAWIKYEMRPYQNHGYIVAKGNDTWIGGSYAINIESSDGSEARTQVLTMTAADSILWATSPQGLLKAGRWYHIVGVINGTTAKIYINGVMKATLPFRGSIGTTDRPLWIGGQARQGNSYFFKGCIDDVALSDCALSDIEVKSLYDMQR